MAELMVGLAQYFAFYNAERPHQSLGYGLLLAVTDRRDRLIDAQSNQWRYC